MFFYLSKILTWPLQPSNLVVLLIVGGMLLATLTRRVATGVRMTTVGTLGLLTLGFSPLANLMIYPLEQRFATVPAPAPGRPITGIIMLGGFESSHISTTRPGLALNEGAERMTEAIRIAHRFPDARVVFTGGVAALVGDLQSADQTVRSYLIDVGITPERLTIETASRNTWENALFTRDIVKPRPGERWLLVTSAYHMPRAVGVFRQVGFDVQPYPVDYRTAAGGDLTEIFSSWPSGLSRVDETWREWVGLVAYRVTGRTSALWPGP